MLPALPDPGTPADWLRHARSDLALASVAQGSDILLEALCFHVQQAAEKSVKAVLTQQAITFPKTHNLKVLVQLLPSTCPLPDEAGQLAALTDYAVISRYPGSFEPLTEDEYREALHVARAVLAWAETAIAGAAPSGSRG